MLKFEKRTILDIELFRKTNGSVHSDEASLLYAITKLTSPMVIVEFGTGLGLTAANFLNAMDKDCFIYTIDTQRPQQLDLINDNRLKFLQINQVDFNENHIGKRKIDLVYIDASHDFELNKKTYSSIISSMSDGSYLILHDTAKWAGQNGEVLFAKWLEERHSRIDFHCDRKMRWGITVFQIFK